MGYRSRLLALSGALAAGEAAAAACPQLAVIWPAAGALAVLAALFGYALSFPLWREIVFFFFGAAAFFFSSLDSERLYLEKPWMREFRRARQGQGRNPRLAAVREDFSRRLAIGVDESRGSVDLSRAILLGERSRIDPAVKRSFVEAGTVHVFAISGLHVMVVAGVLTALMSLSLVPWRWCGAFSLPVLWGYVAVIGAPPSAVRAASMASLAFLAPVFRRRADPLAAWSLTFIAVHLLSPSMIKDVGCRLSFTVMLALVVAAEFAKGRFEGWRSGLFMGFAAWAAGAPIAAAVFSRVTPGGLVANFLLLPAAGAAVSSGVAGILASYVSETLASHLNNLSGLFVRAMVAVSIAVADLPGANFEIEALSPTEAAAWYVALPLVPVLWRRFRRRTL